MQAAGNAGTLQWLLVGVLLAGLNKTGHLLLGQLNLSSAKGREVDVRNLAGLGQHDTAIAVLGKSYLELLCWFSHCGGLCVGKRGIEE